MRKIFALFFLILITGCEVSKEPSDRPITLRFAFPGETQELKIYTKLIEAFEEKYPQADWNRSDEK